MLTKEGRRFRKSVTGDPSPNMDSSIPTSKALFSFKNSLLTIAIFKTSSPKWV